MFQNRHFPVSLWGLVLDSLSGSGGGSRVLPVISFRSELVFQMMAIFAALFSVKLIGADTDSFAYRFPVLPEGDDVCMGPIHPPLFALYPLGDKFSM
jgi:hypothetical protein